MKVLFSCVSLGIGGIERLVVDLYKFLKSNPDYGITPGILVLKRKSGFTEEVENNSDVFILSNEDKKIKTSSFSLYPKFRRIVKSFKPDIIHFNGYPSEFIGSLSSFNLPIKRISHIHNFHFIGGKKRIFKYKLLNPFLHGFIYVSQAVKNSVNPLYNPLNKPAITLYNFIIPERINELKKEKLNRKDLNIPENATVALFVGRLTENKNVESLLKAVKIINTKHQNFYLIIVGGGKLEKKLQNYARAQKLNNVIFTGFDPNPIKYMKISDIFVLPSKVEGFGIAHLEAMYCGLPAVISKNVPSAEIANQCSVITDTTPQSIANGILELIKDKKLRENFSKEAKKIAHQYTIQNYVLKLRDFYSSIKTS
ncbi:Glycosyltransferase involved in cell wall bisynthesis [Desulfurobacterium pacificum]|uniref:Glycosyltransferase involved in cell wall bisynthesis n=1 Tax=Desulfurobacterium pacificum TaxID=240166 RepID=A0ABY1NKD2_9BACT|nr:glycosyltransferase [Desulfurobacterium pacificum]SMP12005.1 Glycosyltransferase involved in cell wall bisynthesis [Desulfurobacterium pacificum]